MAAGPGLGRVPGSCGYHDVQGLKQWLDPFIDSQISITYTTERKISAMSPQVLSTEKWENIMKTGKVLSDSWNFGVVAMANAISLISQASEEGFKETALQSFTIYL